MMIDPDFKYSNPIQGSRVSVPCSQYQEYKKCLNEKLDLLSFGGDVLFGSQLLAAVDLVLADHPEWASEQP